MADKVPIIIIGFVALGLILERLIPARRQASSLRWYVRGAVGFVVTMATSGLVPTVLGPLLQRHAPFPLTALRLAPQVALTFFATQLVGYWFHRLLHRNAWLWRHAHRLHHSADRVDVVGSAYFHPLDILLQTAIGTALVALLGVSADAAALATLMNVFLSTFQHLNVRTPHWLGYVIQRPEAHSVHHARGVHAYNYAGLACIDQIFGTLKNPAARVEDVGLTERGSEQVAALLMGRALPGDLS